jgi:hypothetical protein
MTNKETKLDLIQALSNRGVYFKQINDVEFRTRCPYCGDSSRENTGHLYMRINPDDDFNVVFHCFKCEEAGVLTSDNLSMFDIEDIDLKSNIYSLNKTAKKVDNKNIATGIRNKYFDYKIPDIHIGKKTEYIEKRLGLKFNNDDYKKMKMITSLREFLILNGIKKITCHNEIAFRLEDHYVGFLSYGNSHILFRDITNREKIKWVKYPITEESKENRLFYSMCADIDVLTTDSLVINLGEGVLDTLSAFYNLGFDGPNTMNISVSGKYYDKLLLYLIELGLVGSNITINIFSDNDEIFNKKNNNPTNIDYYRRVLKNYKYLYGQINVYYNTIGKDIGVPRQEISLKRYIL